MQDVYPTLSFEDALEEVVRRMGPVKASTLRFYVSRSFEELTVALMNLEQDGRIAKVMALVPEPEAFFCAPDEVDELMRPRREDRTVRILTQSDPYVSRFIWEVRSVLDRGWYLPIFKGVDPIGKVLMFKVNDYLEIKDLHVPTAYLDEFCEAFNILLDNHAAQLVDVSVLSNFNSEPITSLDETTKAALEGIGFKVTGERMIRGAVVDPQPREIAERALFHNTTFTNPLAMKTKSWRSKSLMKSETTLRLRGRSELYRVDLKSMASAHRLHQGINLARASSVGLVRTLPEHSRHSQPTG